MGTEIVSSQSNGVADPTSGRWAQNDLASKVSFAHLPEVLPRLIEKIPEIAEIVSQRLRLHHLPIAFLEACLADDLATAERLIGLKIPPDWLREEVIMRMRLQDCRDDSSYAPWSLRAMILTATQVMIGTIGFHTRPDPGYLRPFVANGVEFGYTVYAAHRRQGYALEACQALMGWAVRQGGIEHFVVSITPTNVASQSLAKKLGFVKVGEQQDEIDGLEEVFVLAITDACYAAPQRITDSNGTYRNPP